MRASERAIILLGRPGSGKDTQAELLVKKFGLIHIITSKLIKQALASPRKNLKLDGDVYNVEKERELQKSGELVSFKFAAALVESEIRKIAAERRGAIMSGSPRTLVELKEELPLLKKLYGNDSIYFFHVAISPKEVYVRNLKRQRKDLPELDTKKMIKKRLLVFMRDTWPVIKFLRSKKMIIEINGEQPIMKIHKDILWQLQSKMKTK